MPINMMTEKIYRINYCDWAKELYAKPIFINKNIQKIYVDKWIQILKEQDELSCKDFFDPQIRGMMLKEKVEAPEIFQLPVYYNSNSLYIHFRVSRIIQMIENSKISTDDLSEIDINEFTDKRRNINWTQTKDGVDIKTQPILMAPLTIGKYYQWIVIDGNHRITDAIAKGRKKIKSIDLDPNWLVQNNLFCNGFDKYLYVFQNEMVVLGTYIHKERCSDEKAFALSYIFSKSVQCYV